MAQRNSDYDRNDREFYPTPAWCTRALLPHIPARISTIWEPAAGDGAMLRELAAPGRECLGSDIDPGHPSVVQQDFLKDTPPPSFCFNGIITNPPYGLQGRMAEAFIRRALALVRRREGFVAMLLRVDFDSGKTRRDMFADCPAWAAKIVLTRRIVWVETPGKKAAPSENHAWFIWDFQHKGLARIKYYFEDGEIT